MSAPVTQVRLLLVEDVPQVAQYIRSLLKTARAFNTAVAFAQLGPLALQMAGSRAR